MNSAGGATADRPLFSRGVDAFLDAVRPHGHETSSYPPGLVQVETRQDARETLHPWFVRMVDCFCHGAPEQAAIEDNMALFATLHWRKKKSRSFLRGANIVALITEGCDLDEYYLSPDLEARGIYLRLDFDYATLGDPFSHPLPHIHMAGESPRFALDGGNAGNIVVDYVEFLYRQFHFPKWKAWAEQVWNDHYFALDTLGESAERNPFPYIMKAFADNDIGTIGRYRENLARLKQLLRIRKDERFAFSMDTSHRELVEYPARQGRRNPSHSILE